MPLNTSKLSTTVELFCGIGGFRTAAEVLGIETIWANDVSQLACTVYKNRFGKARLHEGDINELLASIPKHDILTAGFPCQPFSAAGKKEGIRDPRGTLFQSIVDVVGRLQPKHFILENVKRLLSMENGIHFSTVLAALSSLNYFVEWRVLNAKDFSLAQNRERVLIAGTRIEPHMFSASDAGSLIRLASSADLNSGPRGIQGLLGRWENWKSLEKQGTKFPFWGVAVNGKFLAFNLELFSAASPPVLLKSQLEPAAADEYDYTQRTIGWLHKNEAVDRFVNGVEIISNQAGGARMGYTIFGIGGISPTLTASTSRHYERYKINERYRRLTPVEYARLQGFADDHCSAVAGYDQYTLYGNAVPPPMANWVFNQLLRTSPLRPGSSEVLQPELFDA